MERLFGWLKELRRLGTRYCKLAEGFAVIIMWLAGGGVYDITFRTAHNKRARSP
ncbi:hypothetical protein CC207_11385 [Pseudomonas sp. DrBHI1]|nr:hypothetical protein CC207_11385 [Pseudomonas sp. DrBHI1]